MPIRKQNGEKRWECKYRRKQQRFSRGQAVAGSCPHWHARVLKGEATTLTTLSLFRSIARRALDQGAATVNPFRDR